MNTKYLPRYFIFFLIRLGNTFGPNNLVFGQAIAQDFSVSPKKKTYDVFFAQGVQKEPVVLIKKFYAKLSNSLSGLQQISFFSFLFSFEQGASHIHIDTSTQRQKRQPLRLAKLALIQQGYSVKQKVLGLGVDFTRTKFKPLSVSIDAQSKTFPSFSFCSALQSVQIHT